MSIDSIDKTTDAPVVEEQTYQYPGTPTTCDGAEAVVWVETNITRAVVHIRILVRQPWDPDSTPLVKMEFRTSGAMNSFLSNRKVNTRQRRFVKALP